MRPTCYVPAGGAVVETCTRTIHGRLLLRPGPDANEMILGVLGRALDFYQVDLYGLSVLGSHYHLLFGADSALKMARFECYLNGNLAKKVGRLHKWRDKFWSRRYRAMAISDEPDAQLARLKYLLANGVKEGLVESPLDWPGPNMARSILEDKPLVGYWFNGTKEWAARRRGEDFGKYDYATRYEIEIQQLPAFQHLTKEEYRDLIARLVREVEEEAAEQRGDKPVLGVERILSEDPHLPAANVKKSPAPMLFFAKCKELLETMKADYQFFVDEYREAADRLITAQTIGGVFNPRTEFPFGSFPPALQFVGPTLLPPPPRPPSRHLEYDENDRRILWRGDIPVVKVPRKRGVDSGSPPEFAGMPVEVREIRLDGRAHDPPSMRPS